MNRHLMGFPIGTRRGPVPAVGASSFSGGGGPLKPKPHNRASLSQTALHSYPAITARRDGRHSLSRWPPQKPIDEVGESLPVGELAIVWLAQEILHTNARAELERDLAEADQGYLTGLIEAKSAQIVLHALVWRDRMAREIGWNPMRFDEDRKRRLCEIVRSKLPVYKRLEHADAATPV
jgi:hypothetical protein